MRPTIADEFSYSHLLALYLGGGHLDARGRLRVTCAGDRSQVAVDAATSMRLVALDRTVRSHRTAHPAAMSVECQWPRWPEYLPGRAATRRILLAAWQQDIVGHEPEAFLRGLIEADGCRTINRFSTTLSSGRVAVYAYPRYFFANTSADIRGLFCAACDRIGVDWTQSNHRTISVAHRCSVARLDAFAGPQA